MKSKALLHLTGRIEMLLSEWVPVGPNNFSFLADRLECATRDAECVLTSETDEDRNAAALTISGEETLTLKVVDFEDMDYIRFEARPRYAVPGAERKQKVIGVELGKYGRVCHGMRLLPRDDGPCRYSVDDLALISADLVTDTSRTMNAILNPYQKQMLDVIFGEGTVHRDKFLVVQAEAIEPAVSSVQDILDNAGYRAELQQILGPLYDRQCFDAQDGSILLSGANGILLVSPNPEKYEAILSFAALMGCLNGLQDNMLSKIWRSWDMLDKQKELVLSEGMEKIEEIQWALSSLNAENNIIGAVPTYLEQTMGAAERFFEKAEAAADPAELEFIRKTGIARSLQKVKDRLADVQHVIRDFGTEIENVRLLAGTLVEKETAGINRAMNILTVVSVIILPLTLITGWYGMNFMRYGPDGNEIAPWNMPELFWPYSYLVVIAVALMIVLSLSYFFYRQGLLLGRKKTATRLTGILEGKQSG